MFKIMKGMTPDFLIKCIPQRLERALAQSVERSLEVPRSQDRTSSVDIYNWASFRSNQWSTTGSSKAVVCAVLSVGKCI
jgi:hypothetical protein